ncbi:condensation domain-containing protein [Roseobacter sp.]|uniref:condensation domain-containing protein n=1 Tax=Roseobacter sp. TaxID=1907202 RepID=UPI00329916A4
MNQKIQDAYPVSPGQVGILFQSLSATTPGAYVIQIRIEISGHVDPDRETQAWEALIARHDSLRTAFVWKGQKQPLQVVGHRAKLHLAHVDISHMPTATQGAHCDAWMRDDRAAGFDLSRAPLLRVCRFTLNNDRHVLVVTFHHAILDGWSIPLLLRDWITLYAGQTVPPAIAFKRHIVWIQTRDVPAATAFWRTELAGNPAGQWHLPAPASPPTQPRHQHTQHIDAPTVTAVIDGLRPHGVTLASAVQGLWALIQSRVTVEKDVVYGLARAGRPAAQVGATQAVGMYVNTLPMRIRVDDDLPAAQWLHHLQSRVQAQASYEHLSLGQVQTAAGLRRDAPVFDAVVIFENYPSDPSLLGKPQGFSITSIDVQEQTSAQLALFVIHAETLTLRLVYDGARVDEHTAARLLTDLRDGLDALARDPQVTLGAIPVASKPAPKRPPLAPQRPTVTSDTNTLGAIWQDILGLANPPDDGAHFFDLGGHSLNVLTLQDRIRVDLGLTVEIPDLFHHATLSAQAAHLLTQTAPDTPDAARQTQIATRLSGRARLQNRRTRTTQKEPASHAPSRS